MTYLPPPARHSIRRSGRRTRRCIGVGYLWPRMDPGKKRRDETDGTRQPGDLLVLPSSVQRGRGRLLLTAWTVPGLPARMILPLQEAAVPNIVGGYGMWADNKDRFLISLKIEGFFFLTFMPCPAGEEQTSSGNGRGHCVYNHDMSG